VKGSRDASFSLELVLGAGARDSPRALHAPTKYASYPRSGVAGTITERFYDAASTSRRSESSSPHISRFG